MLRGFSEANSGVKSEAHGIDSARYGRIKNLSKKFPDFRGDIDTLYAYGAAGPEFQGKTSQYDKKLCALRWHDPDPDREHGRLQWFGFAMYFMHTDQAERTFKASLDWLRQEVPPATTP